MKINEFAQIDELTIPGTLAHKIKKGFAEYVKQQGGQATSDMFLKYINSVGIKSPSVQQALGVGQKTTGGAGAPDTKQADEPEAGPNKTVNTPKAQAKAEPQKASNLNSYFQNFSKAMQGAGDKNQKIALAKELVNIVADRGGQDSNTAVSLLRKFGGNTLDNNFKQAAMNALKKGARMESVFVDQFVTVLAEHDITLEDLGLAMTLTEDRAYIVTLIEANLSDKDIDNLVKMAAKDSKASGQKDSGKPKTNVGGAFASGLRKGFGFGSNPLGTTGKAIGKKFGKAADKYDADNSDSDGKDQDSGNSQDTRTGLNTLKTELGLSNPAMAVKALDKLMQGKPISNRNELEAVKPLIGAVKQALASQQGRARLKQLIKTL